MRSRFISLTLVGVVLLSGTPGAAEPEPLYKTKYRVIDVHVHCTPVTEDVVRAELGVLDRVGVASVVILDADGPAGNLKKWLKLRQKYPERLNVFWKLDFRGVKDRTFFRDIVRDLGKAAEMGVQGVKVWKDLGMYVRDADGELLKADDRRLDPFWTKCGELGLPVLIHTADEREYWYPLTYNSIHFGLRTEKDQHYGNPRMPSWEELIRQRDAVLKKHPETNFIGAHLGSQGHDLRQLEETFGRYPNFYADTSARHRVFGRLNPPAVQAFFQKNRDRILFGTDAQVLVKGLKKPVESANIAVYPTEDPNREYIDPGDAAALKPWQERAAQMYGQSLQYFETDRLDLQDPLRSGGSWLRLPGAKLPAAVLEKLYHANAENLIPGLKKP
jgi:predicted TIM-barrel fold metal-dependent hydrolase